MPPAARLEQLGFVALAAQLTAFLYLAPADFLSHPEIPVYQATIACALVTLVLAAARWLHFEKVERVVLVLFLAGMPFVYAGSARAAGNSEGLRMEWIGVPVFVLWALVGAFRTPWVVASGILAHGLAWDLWHYGHSAYIPDWYAAGCLISDVGIAAFAWTKGMRVPRALSTA